MSLDHKSWSGPFQRNAALCTRTIWVKNLHVGGQHLFREVGSFLWWTDNIPGQTPVHIIAPKGRKVLNILSSFVCISPLAKLSLASYWPSSHALRIDTQPAFLSFINCLSIKSKTRILWSSGETARSPPTTECSPGLIPTRCHVWVELLCLLRGFFSRFSGFSPSTKTNIFKSPICRTRREDLQENELTLMWLPIVTYLHFC